MQRLKEVAIILNIANYNKFKELDINKLEDSTNTLLEDSATN